MRFIYIAQHYIRYYALLTIFTLVVMDLFIPMYIRFQIDWLAYFNHFLPMPVTEDELVVSFAMKYLRSMGKLVENADKSVLTNYLLWRLILGLAPEMTEKFQRERNEYRRVLQVYLMFSLIIELYHSYVVFSIQPHHPVLNFQLD